MRSYDSCRPTRIEIIELDGPNHCLTFRWVIGLGKERNQDNNYTFCPVRGFTNFRHNNEGADSKKMKTRIKSNTGGESDTANESIWTILSFIVSETAKSWIDVIDDKQDHDVFWCP